jgi:hypothetical protein
VFTAIGLGRQTVESDENDIAVDTESEVPGALAPLHGSGVFLFILLRSIGRCSWNMGRQSGAFKKRPSQQRSHPVISIMGVHGPETVASTQAHRKDEER